MCLWFLIKNKKKPHTKRVKPLWLCSLLGYAFCINLIDVLPEKLYN